MGILAWLFGMKNYSVSLASVHTIYARILNNSAQSMTLFSKLEATTKEIQSLQAKLISQEKKLKKQEKKDKVQTKLLKDYQNPLNRELISFVYLFKQLSTSITEIIFDTQKQLYVVQTLLKTTNIKTENQVRQAQIDSIISSLQYRIQEILNHIYIEHRQLHSGLLSTEQLSDFTISSEIKQLREIKRAAIDSNSRYSDKISINNFNIAIKNINQILTNLELITTNAKLVLSSVEANYKIAVEYSPSSLKGMFKRAYKFYKSKTKKLEKESKRQLNEAA